MELAELKKQLAVTGGGEMVAEEYASGQVKSRGYIKGKNIRTGEWTSWHENGQKKSQGRFVDHEKVGEWVYWHESGRQLPLGARPVVEFHENGQRKSEGFNKGGSREGVWTEWHDNGQRRSEVVYKNGKREGMGTRWHDNRQKESEGEYKNGATGNFLSWKPWREGVWTYWDYFGNGSIDSKRSGIYKGDKRIAPLPKKK